MIKAVVFDMDGVLVNSEYYWGIVERDLLPELGVAYSAQTRAAMLGKNLTSAVETLRQMNPTLTEEKIRSTFMNAAIPIYGEQVELAKGAIELLTSLREKHIHIGLASSSPVTWVDMVLDRFQLRSFFEVVLSTETHHIIGKPDPAIYLLAMEQFGVRPDETLIVEDSPTGIEAGKRSGATVVEIHEGAGSLFDIVFPT